MPAAIPSDLKWCCSERRAGQRARIKKYVGRVKGTEFKYKMRAQGRLADVQGPRGRREIGVVGGMKSQK